ncbi:MAG TPA: hypothetical protein VN602_10670 [Gemmatimonadaceae bacterium]|nr:hypothetical protein [Gemmatimonadaceae bacterium]
MDGIDGGCAVRDDVNDKSVTGENTFVAPTERRLVVDEQHA